MNIGPLAIEEYQRVTRRQETHEARYYQMLALCITGFTAVLGLSDKIPRHLIPYILSPLLLITSRVAWGNWLLQQLNAAYLLHWYENQSISLAYEGTHNAIFIHPLKKKTTWLVMRRFLSGFTRDFALLNIMAFSASIYFSLPLLKL